MRLSLAPLAQVTAALLSSPLLSSLASGRPQRETPDTAPDTAPDTGPHSHRRRGVAPLPADLQHTLDSFRQLQADLSRSVLALDRDDDNSHTLSYEIEPLGLAGRGHATSTVRPPIPLLSTTAPRPWERPHRLRHHGRHRPRPPPPDDFSFRVNANVLPNAGRASFTRSLPSPNVFSGFLKPQKGCPSLDGRERLLCPSKSPSGYHVCIQMDQLCNHRSDCPQAEDENPLNCLFYRTTMGHFKKVVDAVVSLTDHMVKAEEEHGGEL